MSIPTFQFILPHPLFKFFFWPGCVACRILVPLPGIKPAPPAVEAQSLNHGTTREVPRETLDEFAYMCKYRV